MSGYLPEKIVYHALKVKHGTADFVSDYLHDETKQSEIKNVCAKVHISLSDRVDNVVSLLDISKRQFIEAALIGACDMSEETIKDLGVIDHLTGE